MSFLPDPVTSYLVEKARDWIINEVRFLCAVKEEVEEMQIELQWMQSFLEDADHQVQARSRQRQSRVFRQWVLQVKEASLDAEDIVDTYLVKLALRKRGGILNSIKKYACIVKQGIDIHAVGSEIDAIKSRLSSLRTKLQTYGIIRDLGHGEDAGSSADQWQKRSNYAHISDRNVVGLETKIREVVDLLLKEQEPCTVVSIYGLGGLGKTTLAKKVYQSDKIRGRFDKFAWLGVSQQFKPRDVWESIYIELTSPSPEQRNEIRQLRDHEMASKLSQTQKDHKCLLLLDDVWSIQDWTKLSAAFPLEEMGGSKIVITTRNIDLAEHVDQRGRYGGLEPMSDEQGMELLRMIAISGRDDMSDKESMENLGKEMLEHCAGLPLAISILGGILATKHNLREWESVHGNIKAYLRRGKGHNEEQCLGVYEVLAYSYYDLPHQLKSCFLYLSQFPEDHDIKTNKLLKMWMAEGLVSVQYDGDREEEIQDVAERYLKELVDRCMIQVGRVGCTGRIQTCRLHDLMREMCLSKAKEENFIKNSKSGNGEEAVGSSSIGKTRRLSFYSNADDTLPVSDYKTNYQLRSLILCNDFTVPRIMEFATLMQMEKNFTLLRMLVVEGANIRNRGFVREIGNLIHLRYLSLRDSAVDEYPSLQKLGCLETLDLRFACNTGDRYLAGAYEILKMKQIRHVYFPDDPWFSRGKGVELGYCPTLQTLVNFETNCEVGEFAKFSGLRKLTMTRSKLDRDSGIIISRSSGHTHQKELEFSHLSSLSLSSDFIEDLEATLAGCPNLYKLRINAKIENFPHQFPRKLTRLSLSGCYITDGEHIETTLGNLPNLNMLGLLEDSFLGSSLCFRRGSFPQLKLLGLSYLKNLEELRVDEGAMPILQALEIYGCEKLEMVPEGLKFINTLKEMSISNMSDDFTRNLKEGGSEFYKVQHVVTIHINKY